MGDHFDAPGFTSPDGDGRVDICDHFVFLNPEDRTRTVLALDVVPLAKYTGSFQPDASFRTDALYRTLIDTDGDLVADLTVQYTFENVTGPDGSVTGQLGTVQMLAAGEARKDLISGALVSFGSTPIVTAGFEGVEFFAGIRSEPFFFDTPAYLNNLSFANPGTDYFIDDNVFSIVLEVPNELLRASSPLRVWTQTLVPSTYDPNQHVGVDQMGRSLVNTFYNSGDDENTFNTTPPALQRDTATASGVTFLEKYAATLVGWGYTKPQAGATAQWLLPDALEYDHTIPTRYPNGRRLQDDTVDFMLNQLTDGQKPSDYVGPHTDYLGVFPYLGAPHTA
jgi:hypothetical protein